MPRSRVVAFLAVVVLTGMDSVRADSPPAPPPPVDDEFLEFLGSVDSDSSQPQDAWWIDYLSRSDAGKAKPPSGIAPAGGAKPPAPAKPAPPNVSG